MQAKKPERPSSREEVYTVRIQRDTATHIAVHERWIKGNLVHREDGPADIIRDATTGVAINEVWLQNSMLHRLDGPAEILRRADTGRVYYSAWYNNGEKISPLRPLRRSRRGISQPTSPAKGPTG